MSRIRIPLSGEMSSEDDQVVIEETVDRISKRVQFGTAAPTAKTNADNGTIYIKIAGAGSAVTVYYKANDVWNGG